jgi:hypothetical protein
VGDLLLSDFAVYIDEIDAYRKNLPVTGGD